YPDCRGAKASMAEALDPVEDRTGYHDLRPPNCQGLPQCRRQAAIIFGQTDLDRPLLIANAALCPRVGGHRAPVRSAPLRVAISRPPQHFAARSGEKPLQCEQRDFRMPEGAPADVVVDQELASNERLRPPEVYASARDRVGQEPLRGKEELFVL